MESFENFQYENASSYGGALSVVDDNSSVYTANTQDTASSSVDLSSLSISGSSSVYGGPSNGHAHAQHDARSGGSEDDFDGVLDDLKDESAVALPPHACRYVLVRRHI